jgi:Protein of unknown function (DUF2974)
LSEQVTEIDHKILSDLVYKDILNNDQLAEKYYFGELTVGDLVESYKKGLEDFDGINDRFQTPEELAAYKQSIHELTSGTSKYQDWKITNIVDNNKESGFVGYTFEPAPGQGVVAFRGSEDMADPANLNDWKNNGSSVYEKLTWQQREALEYINKYGEKYGAISITGHSLGGNVTLASAVLAKSEIRDRITGVFTYNAPGFNKEFLDTNEAAIKEMTPRIKEFQNEDDLVSSLLYNLTTPIIIETSSVRSGGFKGMLDPFTKLMDAHALRHFAQENGQLKRSTSQDKNFSCRFIEKLTRGLQMLPNPLLKGFVETVFAVWSGAIKPKNLIIAAAALALLNPVGAVITVKLLVQAVVVMLAVTLVATIADIVIENVQEFIDKLKAQVMTLIVKTVIDLGKLYSKMAAGFRNFKNQLITEVKGFFSSLGDSVKKWWNAGKGGYAHSEIQVNIARLRELADRLSRVQQRVTSVDRSISALTGLVDLEDKLPMLLLQYKVGYDYDLMGCIQYLNRAADELEQCERQIFAAANAF